MSRDAGAGGGLLDPVVVAAIAVLIVNDHALKAAARGTDWAVVTGKLSDVAGLVFFPVVVLAGAELFERVLRRYGGPSIGMAVVTAVVVAIVFSLANTVVAAGAAYATALGVIQWPARALTAWLTGHATPTVVAVAHVVDPTDVVAIVGVLFVVWQTHRRRRVITTRL